jgi:hypothetical protein
MALKELVGLKTIYQE